MKTVKIDIALIIVFLTGLAYATAYLYESGYQLYYELPTVFIDLNINTLTKSLFFTGLTAGALFLLFTFLDNENAKDSLLQNIPPSILIIGAGVILFCAVNVGYMFAEHKEEYMIVNQKEKVFVVVTTYKDNLVIAPLDIKKETIKPKFQTIEMKDAKETEVINFEHGIKVDKARSSKELEKEMK